MITVMPDGRYVAAFAPKTPANATQTKNVIFPIVSLLYIGCVKMITFTSFAVKRKNGDEPTRVHREIYADTPIFPLAFRAHIYYNICMSNKSSKKARSSAQILAEIAALPPSVQGTISSYKNVRKNGTASVYYNLQYTHKGKNHSFAIPVDKVEDFKAAVTAGRKLKDLVLELSLANAREIASTKTPLKKSSRTSS